MSTILLIGFAGCGNVSLLSFKGISIDPNITSYYVDNFQLNANAAPADLAKLFTEELIQKINNNTRLGFQDTDSDIDFVGSVSRFQVSPVAPQGDDEFGRSAFNRLEIAVIVEYVNNLDEEASWKQTFSFFQDFESTEDLVSVQDDLIDEIFNQITEDIFNKAFTDW